MSNSADVLTSAPGAAARGVAVRPVGTVPVSGTITVTPFAGPGAVANRVGTYAAGILITDMSDPQGMVLFNDVAAPFKAYVHAISVKMFPHSDVNAADTGPSYQVRRMTAYSIVDSTAISVQKFRTSYANSAIRCRFGGSGVTSVAGAMFQGAGAAAVGALATALSLAPEDKNLLNEIDDILLENSEGVQVELTPGGELWSCAINMIWSEASA